MPRPSPHPTGRRGPELAAGHTHTRAARCAHALHTYAHGVHDGVRRVRVHVHLSRVVSGPPLSPLRTHARTARPEPARSLSAYLAQLELELGPAPVRERVLVWPALYPTAPPTPTAVTPPTAQPAGPITATKGGTVTTATPTVTAVPAAMPNLAWEHVRWRLAVRGTRCEVRGARAYLRLLDQLLAQEVSITEEAGRVRAWGRVALALEQCLLEVAQARGGAPAAQALLVAESWGVAVLRHLMQRRGGRGGRERGCGRGLMRRMASSPHSPSPPADSEATSVCVSACACVCTP